MHGHFDGKVSATESSLVVNGKNIIALAEKEPAKLPWGKLNVDVVLECTGIFLSRAKAQLHLDAGAKRVILSAPPKESDIPTVVIGVNEKSVSDKDKIISNASCTTNCLVPMVAVIEKIFGIEQFFMTTVHAYTADQNLQDAPHKKGDLRRARAAAENIVPTSTGAGAAVALVAPHLKDKIVAMGIRVPVPTGSLTDLTCVVKKAVSVEEVNEAFRKASKSNFKGIIEYCEDPIVSSDIIGNTSSCIFDSLLTEVNGNMIKVVGWYDNEAGYSARLAEMAASF
jgi:glyceraldehyde 3-phosphate dehydrogenase